MYHRPSASQIADVFGAFDFQNVLDFMRASDWADYGTAPDSVNDLIDVCTGLMDILLDDDARSSASAGGFTVGRMNSELGDTLYSLAFTYKVYSGDGIHMENE